MELLNEPSPLSKAERWVYHAHRQDGDASWQLQTTRPVTSMNRKRGTGRGMP